MFFEMGRGWPCGGKNVFDRAGPRCFTRVVSAAAGPSYSKKKNTVDTHTCATRVRARSSWDLDYGCFEDKKNLNIVFKNLVLEALTRHQKYIYVCTLVVENRGGLRPL